MANPTYAMDIPALPGLTSGAHDNPAQAILQGDDLNNAHVAASRHQHQNRKRLAKNDANLVTEDELVASKRRKHIVAASNFDGPIPAWGQQMAALLQQMNQAIANVQQQMDQRFDKMDQRMEQMERRMQQESERAMNRFRRNTSDEIVPVIRLVDGQYPADANLWFPRNQIQLLKARMERIGPLMDFYSLPAAAEVNIRVKRARLMAFLGVSL